MGAWNTNINGNDTFQDVYQNFFDLYNQGLNPADISDQIQNNFAEIFDDYDDRNNTLFGLSFAQWETKTLDPVVYKQVKEIIEGGNDLEVWKRLGADEKILKQRQVVLEKFLLQISTEREKPKKRVKPKFKYSSILIKSLPAPDNKKIFEIIESYVNGDYKDTSAGITWPSGGSSVFYFYEKGKFVSARWVDSKTLEIQHDKTIIFTKKDKTFFFCGDQGIINYIEVE